jgi:hypothetical protein
MYINYLNKENFYSDDDCKVEFDFKPLEIKDCANYSNDDYKSLRTKYLEALDKNNTDCINKLKYNIEQSKQDQNKYNERIDEVYKYYTEKQLEKIKNNKQQMEDLQTNIIASEQRLSDSKKNNYRNKIKLIIFIVAIMVFVLIELILIIV